LILQPKWFSIVGYDTDWLSFWGSYMGGVLSSIIAIFILYKQIKQNHSENEHNRELLLKQLQDTHEENEVNRKLELYSIDYHQQKEWLNDMRKACIRNIYSYDVNELIEITNKMQVDSYKAFQDVAVISSNLQKGDTEVAFLGSINLYFRKTFHDKRKEMFCKYSSLVNDIKLVIASLINSKEETFSGCLNYIRNENIRNKEYNDFCEFLEKYKVDNNASYVINIFRATNFYIENGPNYFETVRGFTSEYLEEENKRINEMYRNNNERTYSGWC